MGIKVAYIKYKSCFKSVRYKQLSQNDELWTISNKMLCKTAATLTLGSTYVFLIKCAKNVTTGGNPECSKKMFFSSENELNVVTSGYYYWISTKIIVPINRAPHSFVYVLVLYRPCKKIIWSAQWLFVKTRRSDKRLLWSENSEVGLNFNLIMYKSILE